MKRQRIVWWVLTVACAGVILALSLQSVPQSMQFSGQLTDIVLEQDAEYQTLTGYRKEARNFEVHDKLRNSAHIIIFAPLAFCAGMLARTYTKKGLVPIALPACAAFAIFDEGVQHFRNAGRTFEWADIYRDWQGVLIGVAAAVLVAWILYVYHRRKQGESTYGVSGSGAG